MLNLTELELTERIETIVAEKLREAGVKPKRKRKQMTQEEYIALLQRIKENIWEAPEGTPSNLELIRQDRDSR